MPLISFILPSGDDVVVLSGLANRERQIISPDIHQEEACGGNLQTEPKNKKTVKVWVKRAFDSWSNLQRDLRLLELITLGEFRSILKDCLDRVLGRRACSSEIFYRPVPFFKHLPSFHAGVSLVLLSNHSLHFDIYIFYPLFVATANWVKQINCVAWMYCFIL